MVHGILQFTPRIAFRYVLHRCESRDIRCRESFILFVWHLATDTSRRLAGASALPVFLGVNPAPCSDRSNHRCPEGREAGAGGAEEVRTSPAAVLSRVRRSCFSKGNDNDPSAGSPTETLLRLLLPLNDKVQWTSRDVTGGEPPASPRSEHFTGPFNR